MRVTEDHVRRRYPEPVQDLCERAQPGPPQLLAREVGPQRPEPGAVERPPPRPGTPGARRTRGAGRAAGLRHSTPATPGSRDRASSGGCARPRPAPRRGSRRTSGRARPRSPRPAAARPSGSPTTRAMAPRPGARASGRWCADRRSAHGWRTRPRAATGPGTGALTRAAPSQSASVGQHVRRGVLDGRLEPEGIGLGVARPALEPGLNQMVIVVSRDDHHLPARAERHAELS